MAAILKNRYDVITLPPIVRLLYEIWQADAKCDADDDTYIKIETVS